MKLCCGCVVQKDGSEWGIAVPCDYHNPLPLIDQLAAARALLRHVRDCDQQAIPLWLAEDIDSALAGKDAT
jgi:hypothetical protein